MATATDQQPAAAVPAALLAALCFGLGNLAYRYGDGNALAIAGQRSLVGTLFMSPLLWRASRDGRLLRMLRDRFALLTIAVSGANLVAAAVMLRTLTGPQSGLAIATIPALLLGFNRLFIQHRPVPLLALSICVATSTAATFTGGLGEVTAPRMAIIGAFIVLNAAEILCVERARERQPSSVLVAGAMFLGAILGYAGVLIFAPEEGLSTSGYVAATIVGVMGTSGRWLRGYALPFVGSAVTSSTSQISALVTAAGGVILIGDHVKGLAVALGVVAAASAFTAVVQSQRAQD